MNAKRFLLPMTIGVFTGLVFAAAGAAILLNHMRAASPTNASDLAAIDAPAERAGEAAGLPILWDAPAFSYIDQDGRQVTNRDLLGRPWIGDFIFTRCTTVCPVLTARMMLLQRQLPGAGLRFISFSVDPSYDTPSVLKKYAATWHGDESRWRLLNTRDDATLHETAQGMHVAVQRSSDPINPILHTNRFVLVDSKGRVRGLYDSTDSDAVKQLVVDAQQLTGTPPTQPVNRFSGTGPELYAAAGCQACHAQEQMAPSLLGLAGSTVTLQDGKTVTADDAYLRESIVDPNAKVVAGYPPRMPSYRDQLSDAQIDQIIAYIKSLSVPAAAVGQSSELMKAATQPAADVVDPVCKMTVQARASTVHAEFGGRTYYFCSELCRDQFLKRPSNYVTATSQTSVQETQ